MTDGRIEIPTPENEPVRDYAPGDPARDSLVRRIQAMQGEHVEAPCRIADRWVETGDTFTVRAPHDHGLELATVHAAGREQIDAAVDAAVAAQPAWSRMSFEDRAAIFLRAADLLSGPWRDTMNAATILGQSKSFLQAEIDAACELIDFLRFNVHYAEQLYGVQPRSSDGIWNRMDHRPLEGFVLAITPFNFTAISGNLPAAPALMGNVVVWKPSEKQALAAHHFMNLLQAAGLPDGVINMVHGDGALATEVCTERSELAGIHFTGSSAVLRCIFKRVGQQIDTFRTYPRIVGESGGKDFIIAHPSAEVEPLVVGMGRGAFEYQGQKCSAASRAYVPASIWGEVRDGLADLARDITVGDPADPGTFFGAVIDESAFERNTDAIEKARANGLEILVGGTSDRDTGWFVDPTVIVAKDPHYDTMHRELFGPVLTVYVYEDDEWSETLDLVDTTSEYALTGGVFSRDRAAAVEATDRLRQAAGNFYVNDKPTGAVVSQQPFGGARASGTNDKAGALQNIIRWVSPRAIKETFVPPTSYGYPHLG